MKVAAGSVMTLADRTGLIAMRASSETKQRFVALAASRGLSASALLRLLVYTVLADQAPAAQPPAVSGASDRLTLRLRPGDRALAETRAAARRMKTSSYLVMLIRAHLRAAPTMPIAEIDALKAAVGQLGVLRRELHALLAACPPAAPDAAMPSAALAGLEQQVAQVRAAVAEIVRLNLKSWAIGDA